MNLTEKSVLKLAVSEKRMRYRDNAQTGFGVTVEAKSSGGRKSFFWNAKVNREVYFKALGEFPSTTVSEGRTAARVWSGKANTWKQNGFDPEKNPFEKRKRVEPASTPLFSELLEAYIRDHVRLNTLNPARAEYDVRNLVKNHLSVWLDKPVDKVTTQDVLVAKQACKAHRYIANSVVEFTGRIFNWSAGKRDGKLNFWKLENPAADVSLYPKEKRKRFLQPAELLRVNEELERSETPRDLRDFVVLAIATGARKSNLYAMRWADIFFETRSWSIPMSKSGEGYQVNLTGRALEVLEQRYRKKGDSEFVFPANSKSGHIADVKKNWAKFRKRCGFADVRIHDLRRTRGSYLAISGVSLQQIGAVLGHKSLGSTQIYAQLQNHAIREALEAGDATMERMTEQAKKRMKLQPRKAPKQKLLAVGRG